MLRFLRIRNLAVIESVDVEFEPGFNVLTGETGAGKSILVEAVGLLVGDRASSDLVRTGETQATIEAIFEEPRAAGVEPHELIIRRDITDHGRSRSFINGALATAGALRDLSQRLVELHQLRELPGHLRDLPILRREPLGLPRHHDDQLIARHLLRRRHPKIQPHPRRSPNDRHAHGPRALQDQISGATAPAG